MLNIFAKKDKEIKKLKDMVDVLNAQNNILVKENKTNKNLNEHIIEEKEEIIHKLSKELEEVKSKYKLLLKSNEEMINSNVEMKKVVNILQNEKDSKTREDLRNRKKWLNGYYGEEDE